MNVAVYDRQQHSYQMMETLPTVHQNDINEEPAQFTGVNNSQRLQQRSNTQVLTAGPIRCQYTAKPCLTSHVSEFNKSSPGERDASVWRAHRPPSLTFRQLQIQLRQLVSNLVWQGGQIPAAVCHDSTEEHEGRLVNKEPVRCGCARVHMGRSMAASTQSDAVLQSSEEREAGKHRVGNEDGRLESSPCSLWQSEQEALAKSLSPFSEGCCRAPGHSLMAPREGQREQRVEGTMKNGLLCWGRVGEGSAALFCPWVVIVSQVWAAVASLIIWQQIETVRP
ncbi:hypothetical protein EYF80_006817 [Liparis tanakae]|uniref:Uncharacterized protein n=1 Tax=Liparis tanakae TaxID=230148 RepID=A0A4Z2IXZ0_9TELE|nr:hypothetical protein EYF80_006817 [Liparis tanakae]